MSILLNETSNAKNRQNSSRLTAAGIIAEYNPFHNGHACQIEMLRERHPRMGIIALMSGSITQRGEFAVLDKWTRARLAIQGGCDLVLELPASYVLRSAQEFARGGVQLLARLNTASALAFGTELPDEKKLILAADAMGEEATQRAIHLAIQEGRSYAWAVCHALSSATGIDESVLRQPNTILAMEYLRAIRTLPNPAEIRPIPLPRLGASHHDSTLSPDASDIASAGAIRNVIRREKPDWNAIASFVPPFALAELKQAHGKGLPDWNLLFRALLLRLRTMAFSQLRCICGIREGLEHRIWKAAEQAEGFDGLVNAVSSKRYPKSHVQRILLSLLLNLSKEDLASMEAAGPGYARVLAFNDKGRVLLRHMQKEAAIPVITKVGSFLTSRICMEGLGELSPGQRQLAYDILATDLRNLAFPAPRGLGQDFTTSPIYIPGPLEGSA